MKQWSLRSIVEANGYVNVVYSNCHDNFIEWVKKSFKNTIKVVDVGGGNGRILIEIMPYVSEYYNLDLNEELIKIGKKFFEDKDNLHFIQFDIDSQDLDIICDVVYIDSGLTMIEKPFEALLKFKKVADYTFVNRTRFFNKTSKKSFKWDGMLVPSLLWEFGEQEMIDFCLKNNMGLISWTESSFYIKNNISI